MTPRLTIQNVRERVLDYASYGDARHNLLHGFFHFPRTERDFRSPQLLSGCHFYDIGIRGSDDGPDAMMHVSDPRLFEAFFPTILGRLLGSSTLTLFVKSFDLDYFNELQTIERILAPRSLSYVLLANLSTPIDSRSPLDFGNLVFEWPKDELRHVVDQWFMSPTVTIEGYAASSSAVSAISHLYFEPDTEERVRTFLRAIDFGFRLWRDNDGLFLVTDKLDEEILKDRLSLDELNREVIRAAERRQPEVK